MRHFYSSISSIRICSTGGVKYLLVVNLGHVSALPKSAEHVTSVPCTLSAVVFQVTVFVPDSSLVPLFMLNGTLALPHTVTEQVNVTSSLPDADLGLTLHVGDEFTAEM